MSRLLASWFGTGLILRRIRGRDIGSGTLASIVTLPISLLLREYTGWRGQLFVVVVVVATGLWAVRRHRAEGDAGWIVIDEAAGTLVATVGLSGAAGLIAFVVFRLADIFKNGFPVVHWAEGLAHEWGVMADDVVAGLYGLAAGYLVATFM